jgi:hypothetical protein
MTHDPNLNVAHGDPVVPLDQRNWGPGGPRPRSALVELWTPSSSVGWRAYHKAMFPPGGLVTPWIRFKKMSTGVNVARRLWDQREELREAYEARSARQRSRAAPSPSASHRPRCSGSPSRCLGCQWIDSPVPRWSNPGWRDAAAAARRHESSHGEFRGQPTSSSCRWGHPALMRATLGRVTPNRRRSSSWHIQQTGG